MAALGAEEDVQMSGALTAYILYLEHRWVELGRQNVANLLLSCRLLLGSFSSGRVSVEYERGGCERPERLVGRRRGDQERAPGDQSCGLGYRMERHLAFKFQWLR